MPSSTYYDVTTWRTGDAHQDLGVVINSILDDVRAHQTEVDHEDAGRPGAVIHIPPGDYHLRTQVLIDLSYIRIEGDGHGFTSSSIRFNLEAHERQDLHEVWPGGSRVLVDLEEGAAFVVAREGSPRISSVEFSGFCIDGLHFRGNGPGGNPENSYSNGLTGIEVRDANDSFKINSMGLVYLEHGLVIRKADALSVHDSFIAECGSCIELLDWGQACKVTDNHVGAGPWGHSVYAENHGGLLVTANNVFPRGDSSIRLSGVTRSNIASNRLHSFYPGMVVLDHGSRENLIGSNHLLRDMEPWTPFADVTNGREETYGVIRIDGDQNSVIGNHVSMILDPTRLGTVAHPARKTERSVAIRLAGGSGNYVATNNVVAHGLTAHDSESCFEAQVDALVSSARSTALDVTTVYVDTHCTGNTVLDSGSLDQVVLDTSCNACRPTPQVAGT